VLATTKGAVPVATVDVICPLKDAVVAPVILPARVKFLACQSTVFALELPL
jgi:hypothetical protein